MMFGMKNDIPILTINYEQKTGDKNNENNK